MRRYYFDFLHDNTLTRDDEGSEHPTDEAARREMHLALIEISQAAAPPGEAWQLVGVVRDESRDIWRGRLSFDAVRASNGSHRL